MRGARVLTVWYVRFDFVLRKFQDISSQITTIPYILLRPTYLFSVRYFTSKLLLGLRDGLLLIEPPAENIWHIGENTMNILSKIRRNVGAIGGDEEIIFEDAWPLKNSGMMMTKARVLNTGRWLRHL